MSDDQFEFKSFRESQLENSTSVSNSNYQDEFRSFGDTYGNYGEDDNSERNNGDDSTPNQSPNNYFVDDEFEGNQDGGNGNQQNEDEERLYSEGNAGSAPLNNEDENYEYSQYGQNGSQDPNTTENYDDYYDSHDTKKYENEWDQSYEGEYDGGEPESQYYDDPTNNISEDYIDEYDNQEQVQNQEEVKKEAEGLLNGKDSIMEPKIIEAIDNLIHMFDWTPENVVTKLVQNYTGYAQMVHLLNDWLIIANQSETAPTTLSDNSIKDIQNPTNNDLLILSQLMNLIKSKFDKTIADGLLDVGTEVPSWLLDMMTAEDPTWRRLLIELYDQNRGSALLGYCLRKISSLGYHSDIAELIGEADYFTVFRDLITDILSRVCAVSAEDMDTLYGNLKRLTCSAEYTFLYIMSLFQQLDILCQQRVKDLLSQSDYEADATVTTTVTTTVSVSDASKKRKYDSITGEAGGNADSVDGQGAETKIVGETNEINNSDSKDRNSIDNGGVDMKTEPVAPESSSSSTRAKKLRELRSISWKMKRLRQELENSQIWEKIMDFTSVHSGGTSHSYSKSMDTVTFFSLRLTNVNVPFAGTSGGGGSGGASEGASSVAVRREVVDMMKRGHVDVVHMQRILAEYWKGWESRSVSSRPDPLLVTAEDIIGKDKNLSSREDRPPIGLIRHPQVLELLMDSFIHPIRTLSCTPPFPAYLLALATTAPCEDLVAVENSNVIDASLYLKVDGRRWGCLSDEELTVLATKITSVIKDLIRCRELCLEMNTASFGISIVFDVPEEIIALMKTPVASACVLRRVLGLIRDKNFLIGTSYMNLLPIFLQLILVANDSHPLQRKDCFTIIKEILLNIPETNSERVESHRLMGMCKDALDAFLHIIGSGYLSEPIQFLKQLIPTLDATLLRHIVYGILQIASPPYSKYFANKICEVMSLRSIREAVSRHFHDYKLLQEFCNYILANTAQLQIPFSFANDVKALLVNIPTT